MLARIAVAARLAVGVPDYRRYVEHVRASHPGRQPMDYPTYFRERQAARYGRSATRCC
ncbi:MAG TPA: YbdD/YjiX family protein [Candidatus Saccharimonadia bacterium]|nr:YbdD/YjiX family protein [Candidatus Saccharimonadia bacterium]